MYSTFLFSGFWLLAFWFNGGKIGKSGKCRNQPVFRLLTRCILTLPAEDLPDVIICSEAHDLGKNIMQI